MGCTGSMAVGACKNHCGDVMREHISWQETAQQRKRAREKELARRRAMPLAKLVRPDGSWCWVRAFSRLDAICIADRHGFPCPEGTGFWDASYPTDIEKEIRLR